MLFSKRGNLIFVTKMGDCDLNNELFATHVCKDVRDRPAKRFLTDYLIEDKQTFAVSYARRRVAVASIINVFPCVWRQLSCPVRDNYDGRLSGLTFYSFQPA